MKIKYYLHTLLLTFFTSWAMCQSMEGLRKEINTILSSKNAKVGVSIIGNHKNDTLSIHGRHHFPMQSVFKFHIALATLHQIEQRKLSLNQIIKIDKKDLLPGLYSPLRDKHPEGASLTIAEILEYTVSQSDNVGCDVLLKLIGGPETVEKYIIRQGFKDVSIKINEEVMQSNWNSQFLNWTTPICASEVLTAFFTNKRKHLSKVHHDFIWTIMKKTETGKNRLKSLLPSGTIVAHKTGWSGANKEGVIAAVNDIGVVFLPGGRYFVISVFVTDSKEDLATNERITADIAKATWDYFVNYRK
jgi:beta-lactamase class A